MKLSGTCPKCGSVSTEKEKIMGADTGDLICKECGYTGHWKDFQKEAQQEKKG